MVGYYWNRCGMNVEWVEKGLNKRELKKRGHIYRG
jgi:hypothetical protein